MHAVRILPAAETQITMVRDWYESERAGLGDRLLREIDARLNLVRRFPEMYAIERKRYRRASLDRFPYYVIYALNGDEVTVYRFIHNARNPRSMFRGLP